MTTEDPIVLLAEYSGMCPLCEHSIVAHQSKITALPFDLAPRPNHLVRDRERGYLLHGGNYSYRPATLRQSWAHKRCGLTFHKRWRRNTEKVEAAELAIAREVDRLDAEARGN